MTHVHERGDGAQAEQMSEKVKEARYDQTRAADACEHAEHADRRKVHDARVCRQITRSIAPVSPQARSIGTWLNFFVHRMYVYLCICV